jgi:alpha-L-fucosidase 2
MVKLSKLLGLFFLILYFPSEAQISELASLIDKKAFNPSTVLWFTKPAQKWEDALPIGNGRLGAMVFGTIAEEHIQLNEDTYWSGGPYSTVVKDGYKTLPEIQKQVFEGKYLSAHNLFGRNLMGYPVEQQKYQSLANLHLFFNLTDTISQYKRWLNLGDGIASVTFKSGGVTYLREVFASAPDQVIVVRLTSNKPGSISFTANLRGVRNQSHSNYATDYFRMDNWNNDGLQLTGKSADYMGVEGKLRYDARIKAVAEGGTIKTDGVDLVVKNANVVTLYFAAATNFVNYKDVSANQQLRTDNYFKHIEPLTYSKIKQDAVADYQQLFNRVQLDLPITDNAYLPLPERILKIQTSPDPALSALGYQFGRYLMIASSRPGTQAANLQGIWNNDTNPAWDAKYTTNINTQMNYWPVESGNLSECAEPLTQLIKDITDQGAQVAKEHYGAGGWVLHQNTDIWRVAAPMDGPTWGTFTVGGAWLCTHLWEHYQFTKNKAYLKDVYPLIEGSVRFFMDFLVPHPNGKWLVTNPSTSPENFPDGGGNKPYFDEVTAGFREGTTICAGSSIDMQILYDLFGYYIEASSVLGVDEELVKKVVVAREKLVPPQIGRDGSLQEWADDWKSLEKNHRHFSHMYGLYPGKILYEKRTPALIDAYKKVLNERGDGATGWSRAWKMALWARLGDGNRANSIFKGYLKEQSCLSMFALCGKSPQVDGSFGVTAAITEMLVQSQLDTIQLLPAIPNEWESGQFKGVCTRGAFELNFTWKNRQISKISVLSKAGEMCKITIPQNAVIFCDGKKINFKKSPNNIAVFKTQKDKIYDIQ